MSQIKIFSARHILPISSDPLENGAVAVKGDEIRAVGKSPDIFEEFPEAEKKDFGDAVIMPGLVNCHSHLELTAMRGFLDDLDGDFFLWLIRLTKTRSEHLTDKDIEMSALLGALEGVRAGVTCFGDIGRLGSAGAKALKANCLRGIVFQETEFSPDNKTAERDFLELKEKFLGLRELKTDLVQIGISPHAPYTVSSRLFEMITEYSLAEKISLSIHAAESVEEEKLLKWGEGFFTKIYKRDKINWRSPKMSTIEYFDKLGVLSAQPLLAHCVNVSGKDIRLILESGSKIAHCPKSNAKFGHGVAPLRKFLAKNIGVGLGSDSMASNNTCDLFEEARFATLVARTARSEEKFLQPEKMIKTATLGGAKALGLENEIGTLEVGKKADLIAVSLSNTAQLPVHDIYSVLLFATNAGNVIWTMVNGQELFDGGKLTKVDEGEIKSEIERIANKMERT